MGGRAGGSAPKVGGASDGTKLGEVELWAREKRISDSRVGFCDDSVLIFPPVFD